MTDEQLKAMEVNAPLLVEEVRKLRKLVHRLTYTLKYVTMFRVVESLNEEVKEAMK
jgi:hypothetical protein